MIDIAPGAESSRLPGLLADLVRRNVTRDRSKRAEFDRLRGAVAVIADDHRTALTLRFDFGKLIVHTGVVGVPDITLRGPIATLESLGDVKARGLVGLAWGELREGGAIRRAGGARATSMKSGRDGELEGARGDLKIYGLWTHPVMVRRLLRVLSER